MKAAIEVNFVSPRKMQKLNRDLRGKSYTPAVLSFPYYEKTEEGMLLGEVLICKPEARKLAKRNSVTLDEQINALIVHGAKHILGVHED
uniref:rRNA maturation RNase YbeY n=1 Tax=candidate division WWE3 bacterium TaxID=2053526 RepID=A0A832E0T0_UNCKA